MTLRALPALLLPLALLLHAAEAQADCSTSDPFAEADSAPRVAIVKASPPPRDQPGHPYRMRLQIEQVLKGAATPITATVSFNPMGGTSLQAGHRYLVFFTAADAIQQGCATIGVGEPGGAELVDALRQWLGARDDRARTALLVRLGAAPPAGAGRPATSERALAHLGASPALLAEISAAERAALVGAVPAVQGERAYALSWVLARVRATGSIPAWTGTIGTNNGGSNHRPVQDALELMTNRRDPAYTPGQDFDGTKAEALRAAWVAWSARNAGKPSQEVVAIGARERGGRAPLLHDRTSLAVAVRDERDELTRRVALAACEQLVRAPTSLLPTSSDGRYVDWAQAMAVCSVPSVPARP